MREFKVIDAAVSVDQLRMRLKDNELEQYGEPFTPDFVYEVIQRLPRFSSMRVRTVLFVLGELADSTSGATSKTQRNFWVFF